MISAFEAGDMQAARPASQAVSPLPQMLGLSTIDPDQGRHEFSAGTGELRMPLTPLSADRSPACGAAAWRC